MASRTQRNRLHIVLRKKRETAALRLQTKRDRVMKQETLVRQRLNVIRDHADALANQIDDAKQRRKSNQSSTVFSHLEITTRGAAELAQAGGKVRSV